MKDEERITFKDVKELIYETRLGIGLALGITFCLIFGGDIVSFFG